MYWHPSFPYAYKRSRAIKRAWLKNHGYYKRLARYSAATVVVATLGVVNIALLHTAGAFTEYSASDTLGQSDSSHTTPVFDTNNFDNTPINNNTGLNGPQDVALDSVNHRLFVADVGNSRIMVYNLDSSNNATGTTANFVLGEPDLTSEVGQTNTACTDGAQNNNLCSPAGLFYDSANQRLFVSDTGFNRVLVFDTSGGVSSGMSAVHVIGQANFTGRTAATTQNGLKNPQKLFFDNGSHQLFVADTGNSRLLSYDISGGIVDGMNAGHVLGQANFTSGSGATTQTTLSNPEAVYFDSAGQRLFAGDSGNNRVLEYDTSGGISDGMAAAHVLGQVDFNSAVNCVAVDITKTCGADGLGYDAANKLLFVAGRFRLTIFNLSGGIADSMNAVHVLQEPDFNSSNCVVEALPSQSDVCGGSLSAFYNPAQQTLFVAEGGYNRIVRYDFSGGITDGMDVSREFGQIDYLGNENFKLGTSDNQNPNPWGFDSAISSNIDPVHHRMYVVDQDNSRVLVFNLNNSNQLVDRTADYVLGQPDFSGSSPRCTLDYPLNTTQSSLCDPTQIAVDSVHDRIFVTEIFASRVMVFDFSGGITNGMNASYELGQVDFSGNANVCDNTTAHEMCDADGAVYDSANERLFVSDSSYSRVLVFDVDPSTITSGEDADNVLGASDMNTIGNGSLSDTDLFDPQGLAYDSVNKYLFVTDYGNGRVTVFDLSGGISDGMAASWVLGKSAFGNSTCGHSQTVMCGAYGISYDESTKRLFVSDPVKNRVLEWSLWGGISNGMPATAVIGQPDFTSQLGWGTSQTDLDTPMGLDYDSQNGKLYVADYFNNRIQVFDIGLIITTTSLPAGTDNSPYSATVEIQDPVGNPTFSISSGSLPTGLSIDSATGDITGTPTVEGTYNFTVQVTDEASEVAAKNFSTTITHPYAASDLLGQVDGGGAPIWDQSAVNNNSGSVNAEGFNYPDSTVMDTIRHRLFVADNNNRILVYNLDASNNLIDHTADFVLGQPDLNSGGDNTGCDWNGGTPSATNMCSPEGISFDEANNRLFVPDNFESRVLVFDFSGGISNGMAASNVLGQPNPGSFGCATTQAGLCNPYGGSVYDPLTHYLYIADLGNHRVMVFDTSSLSDGMNAAHVIGEPNFTTPGNWSDTPTQSNVIGVNGLAIDSAGHRLFVADWNDSGRVMVFDTTSVSDGMAATNVLGEKDFTSFDSASDNGDPPDAKSFGPTGLSFDSKHNLLFVSDDNDYRVMIFDTTTVVDNEDAVGELGQLDFISNDVSCTTSRTSLCDPEGADQYYDTANERLYLADSGNNRVMIYDFARLAAPAPDGTQGTAYNFGADAHSQGTTGFSMTSGALPGGLSLDASTGVISGTPNTAGTFNFGIHLADDNSTPGTFLDDHNYSMNIAPSGGDSTPPSVPAGVQVTGTSNSSISLSWTASSDNVGVTGYHVYRNGVQVGAPGGTSFTDTGLTPSTIYNYTVSAFDAATNESAQSSPSVPGTTDSLPDSTPPSTPGGLHVTGTTTSTISLAWTASSDNVAVQGYNIYRDGGSTPIASAAGTSFTDSGLGAGAAHTYTVTAYDAASNESGHSGQVSGSTQSGSGGSSGTGSTPSAAPKPPSTPAQAAPGNVDLDGQPAYTNGSGYTQDSPSGQTFTFTDNDNQTHTITVEQAADGSTTLRIDSTNLTLNSGDTSKQDVNGDGHDDISISLNGIGGGKANLTFKKIILAVAPGGQTASGFGAGNASTPSASQKATATPLIIKLVFPWLLFILLGLSAARLAWQSFKERRLAATLLKQLALEKALGEEKTNFVSLSSHYLRTPVAAIANGIELLAGVEPANPASQELLTIARQLSGGVNNLLTQAGRLPSEVQPAKPGVITPLGSLAPLAAGFVKISTLPAITLTMAGSFVVVIIADYIIKHTNIYNVSLVNFLTQLAAWLAITIFFYASYRSHRKNKEYRQQNERLLEQQRELDIARNTLVKNSLQNLKQPLAELKAKLQANLPAKPQIAKPALDGIAQLEGLLNKFTILASLESGTLQKLNQPLQLDQLVNGISGRYANVLQSKGLNIKADIGPQALNQDRLLLSFVIDSLLSNAIKYSPQGGQIDIASRQNHSGVQISVRDKGPGIDQAKLAELFQPFSRAENAAQDFNLQGAGLSLYLDKLVMRYLGGQIDADSQPGHGTTVNLSVPA